MRSFSQGGLTRARVLSRKSARDSKWLPRQFQTRFKFGAPIRYCVRVTRRGRGRRLRVRVRRAGIAQMGSRTHARRTLICLCGSPLETLRAGPSRPISSSGNETNEMALALERACVVLADKDTDQQIQPHQWTSRVKVGTVPLVLVP